MQIFLTETNFFLWSYVFWFYFFVIWGCKYFYSLTLYVTILSSDLILKQHTYLDLWQLLWYRSYLICKLRNVYINVWLVIVQIPYNNFIFSERLLRNKFQQFFSSWLFLYLSVSDDDPCFWVSTRWMSLLSSPSRSPSAFLCLLLWGFLRDCVIWPVIKLHLLWVKLVTYSLIF